MNEVPEDGGANTASAPLNTPLKKVVLASNNAGKLREFAAGRQAQSDRQTAVEHRVDERRA